MDQRVFETLRSLIQKESGICLTQEKQQLLANRIQKRLRTLGLKGADEYVEIIETDATGEELTKLLDAISTNVTFFYREERHFEILADMLREIAPTKSGEIKIWCAASSSGEEPYTISMVAEDVLGKDASRVRILATDISTRVLHKAHRRVYEEKQLKILPANYRAKYFSKVVEEGETMWRVADNIAARVVYKRLNLAKFPFPLKGGIDIIFCRNVMIYFNRELRAQIVHEFERLLIPGGYLFLSHSENLLGIDHKLTTRATAVYKKSV